MELANMIFESEKDFVVMMVNTAEYDGPEGIIVVETNNIYDLEDYGWGVEEIGRLLENGVGVQVISDLADYGHSASIMLLQADDDAKELARENHRANFGK